jgi:hypothetical protein
MFRIIVMSGLSFALCHAAPLRRVKMLNIHAQGIA